jgi:hypothetical protein
VRATRVSLVPIIAMLMLPLAGWTGHPFDMHVWFETGRLLAAGANIYEPQDHFGYPPAWAYWAALSYTLLGDNLELWRALIKLPQIIGLLLLATLLRRMTGGSEGDEGHSWMLEAPFWIYAGYITLVWGQLNSLTSLSILLTLYLLRKGLLYRSALALGMGIAVKLYPAVALPFFIQQAAHKDWKHAIAYAALSLLPAILVTGITILIFGWSIGPFATTLFYQPFSLLCEGCPGPRPLLNVWSLLWVLEPSMVRSLPAQILWLPLWILTFLLLRRGTGIAPLAGLYLVFVAFFPRVSEQSLLDMIPLLIIANASGRGSMTLRLALVSLPTAALAFTLFNYGLTHFSPLLTSEARANVESFYAEQAAPLSLAMGLLGLLVSLTSLTLLTQFTLSSRHESPVGTMARGGTPDIQPSAGEPRR